MAQETTKEFAHRLDIAISGCPRAPTESYGRLTWLMQDLKARTGLKVSVNAVHKWAHGMSRPREDTIRKIAQVLEVDDRWLSMGHMPDMATTRPVEESAAQARGATLVAAGLIEMSGGRVAFAKDGSTMQVNLAGKQFNLMALAPQSDTGPTAFIIPEPVGDARVLGVVLLGKRGGGVGVELLDLTLAKRQRMGGFSVVQAAENGGKFEPLRDLKELVAS